MPSDPEHSLDKPLRAYARKRREDAGEPALHPATRRMLQNEVARLQSRPGPGRRAFWTWVAWPRLAFAAGVSVVLGVVLWNVLPDRQGTTTSQTLALLDQTEVEKAKRLEKEALGFRLEEQDRLGRSNVDAKLKPAASQPRLRELEEKLDGAAGTSPEVRLSRMLNEPVTAGQTTPSAARGGAAGSNRSQVEALRADRLYEQSSSSVKLAADAVKQSELDSYGVTLAPKSSTSLAFFAGVDLSKDSGKTEAPADDAPAVAERFYRLESKSTPPGAAPATLATKPLATTELLAAPPPAPVLAGAEAGTRARSYAMPAPSRTPAPAATAELARMKSETVTLTQVLQRLRYQRSDATGVSIAAWRDTAASPLALFDLEQSGNQVRLIDADGSVYEGSTSATNAAVFRVSGTNRANGKRLTVQGEFVSNSASNDAGRAITRFGTASREQRAAPAAPAASGAGGPAAIGQLSAGRALHLFIRPEGVAEIRSSGRARGHQVARSIPLAGARTLPRLRVTFAMPAAGHVDRFEFERALRDAGLDLIAGVDEAGRGPLAGPVVAAAALLPRPWLDDGLPPELAGLNDSKQLTAAQREQYFAALTTRAEVCFAIAHTDAEDVDRFNILVATHRAMARALAQLRPAPQHILVDGTRVKSLSFPQTPLVKGDARSYSIAAASVLAKVTRDRLMQEFDRRWPAYGFAEHKGYGTPQHLAALAAHGPCPIHRRSFAPLKPVEQRLL